MNKVNEQDGKVLIDASEKFKSIINIQIERLDGKIKALNKKSQELEREIDAILDQVEELEKQQTHLEDLIYDIDNDLQGYQGDGN